MPAEFWAQTLKQDVTASILLRLADAIVALTMHHSVKFDIRISLSDAGFLTSCCGWLVARGLAAKGDSNWPNHCADRKTRVDRSEDHAVVQS